MNKRLTFLMLALVVVFSLALASCGPAATVAPTAEAPTQAPTPPSWRH